MGRSSHVPLRIVLGTGNLTDEWKERGITEQSDYAILTAEISNATFGMPPFDYKMYNGLTKKNQNLRDHMTDLELIFTMLGEDVKVEHTTSDGRIDLVLKTDKSIFIFELKYKKSADTAMTQISDKDYAKAFADDGRKVVKVGVNFSEDQRSIEDWVIK